MTHLSLPYGKSLLPSTVGFDRLLSTIKEYDNLLGQGVKVQSYPPYNILKEDDENYTIEIAVSGFKRDEIEIDQSRPQEPPISIYTVVSVQGIFPTNLYFLIPSLLKMLISLTVYWSSIW
jgi:hypothetical protein